jgi:inward rectifier potassium channel
MAKKAEYNELGFGTKTSSQKKRLINADGTFNINRTGQSLWSSTSIYHTLISMPWRRFHLIVVSYFLIINVIFAFCYCIVGIDGIRGVEAVSATDKFLEAFFF